CLSMSRRRWYGSAIDMRMILGRSATSSFLPVEPEKWLRIYWLWPRCCRMRVDVLDHGYIILHDKLGTDLTVVNAARASFKKKSTWRFTFSDEKNILHDGDKKLIKFLAKKSHTSPFRHCMVQYEVSAPLFVARQWWKHVVGGAGYDPATAWNESS